MTNLKKGNSEKESLKKGPVIAVNKSDIAVHKSDIAVNTLQNRIWGGGA